MSKRLYRLLLFVLVIGGVWGAAWATGVTELFTSESIRRLLAASGLWGVIAFIVLFSAGQLLRVPGPVFVAAAVAVYGRDLGMVVALLGALTSVNVSFAVVRTLAGEAFAGVQRPIARRLLSRMASRPVMTVAVLRLIFQTAPPLNYALPMTTVQWRDHLLGSMLGLPAPVAAMALFFDWFLHRAA